VIVINKSVRMILQRLTKSYRNDGKKYRGILTVLHNGSFLGFGRDSPWSKFWSCLTASMSDKDVRPTSSVTRNPGF
jgi:hypothetical protein